MTGKYGVALAVGHRGAFQHAPALGGVAVDKLVHQTRLAHPGLAEQGHELALPLPGLRQGLRQRRQLLIAPDKARQPTRHGSLEATTHGCGPDQFEDLHGLRQTLDRHRPQGGDPHRPLDQPQGGCGQANRPRRRQLLHARRQIRGQAHPRVVHVQVVADGAHQHVPGVETDTQQHLQPLGAAHLLSVAPQRGLHRQGGIAGAQGVVLVGNGRAEHGHDAIARHIVHRALKAVHGVHHALQGRIEERLAGFGIEVADQLGIPFEVGKQHRDLFALAFHGASGGEDLLGQIGRGVGQRRRACGRRRRGAGAAGGAASPVHTSTSPSSSRARRWPLMSSTVKSSRKASSRLNCRLRAR